MKKIVVASRNPVKAQSVLGAFQRMFPGEKFALEIVSVPSGVGDQPATDDATLLGAHNRASGAVHEIRSADYWVGIEGGIEDTEQGMAAFAWVVVISDRMIGRGRTGTFFLPERVARLVREGVELGEANDQVFSRVNSKQGDGAIGILTGNVIDRTALYEHAVVMALAPFKNEDLYPPVETQAGQG